MEQFVEQFITHLPYLGVLVVILVAGLGVPIPEDVPLLLGGVLCGLGQAELWIMIPVGLAAVLCGDLIIFSMGHVHKDRIRRLPMLRRFLSDERMARAADAYHSHVGKTLFTARFLPGLRAPLFFTAGSVGIPYWKMIFFDGIAALISVPVWVLVGYYGYNHKDVVLAWIDHLKWPMLLVVLAIVGFGIYYLCKHPPRKRTPADTAPAEPAPGLGAKPPHANSGDAGSFTRAPNHERAHS